MPPPKREACRNFQRGSCRYGDQCKFLHSTPINHQQQQSKLNNNYLGFGKQQQQQQSPNPFGFGTQAAARNNSLSTPFFNNNNNNNVVTTSASKPTTNNFKPFENKWSRFSQNNSNGGSQASRQPDNQPAAANHICTDPETCKRQIAEDFEKERPLWKLTCYGHNKCAPCDIVGDTSYEELRGAAYSDAKQGLSLQSIVERERSLLNAKLLEFETLLRNPYVPNDSSTTTQISSPGFGPSAFSATTQISSPGFGPSAFSATTKNNLPPSVSSFSQLGGSLNTGFQMRPATSQNNVFGQQNSIQVPNQSGFGTNALSIGSAGAFGGQHPNQPSGNFFKPPSSGGGFGAFAIDKNTSFPSPASSQISTLGSFQSPTLPTGPISASATVDAKPRDNGAADNTIWLKEWKLGTVPEEVPPDEYIS